MSPPPRPLVRRANHVALASGPLLARIPTDTTVQSTLPELEVEPTLYNMDLVQALNNPNA